MTRKDRGGLAVSRIVKEDISQKKTELEIFSKKKASFNNPNSEDTQLTTINQALKNMEDEFNKTTAEMAEIFCLVSGRLPKVREYLMFEK